MAGLTRRDMLGVAAMAGGLTMAGAAVGAEHEKPEEIPTFRFAMEKQKGRVTEGGSAKEATARQLPISQNIAGVSMRLKPGGLRELHWHANAAEWAYVVKGRVRTTVIGPDALSETNDFEPGDVWYFPRGHGHALQALGHEEAHFVLVFDNGHFSEHGTFSSTDWLGHLSPRVLSQCLGLPEEAFARFPKEELYIIQGRVPPNEMPGPHQGGLKSSPQTHRYALMAQEPYVRFRGGVEHRVTVKEFPISTTIAGVIMDLDAGAIREPHWHPHADEWLYFLKGHARITIFGSHGRVRTEEFGPGDAGYIPQGFGHHIDNYTDEPCRILIAFNKGDYQEVSLSAWLASNPNAMVADNFRMSEKLIEKLPRKRVFIAPKGGPGA